MSNSGFTSEKLNLTLAICAIFISVASFYATYIQANAAEKQVKAMTLPLLHFASGNYDSEEDLSAITLTLKNAGVGPALIKSVSYNYKGIEYSSITHFFRGCCDKEYQAYKKLNGKRGKVKEGGFYHSSLANTILPSQESVTFLKLYSHKKDNTFWETINTARFNLSVQICYCSILNECYITEKNGRIDSVDACSVKY